MLSQLFFKLPCLANTGKEGQTKFPGFCWSGVFLEVSHKNNHQKKGHKYVTKYWYVLKINLFLKREMISYWLVWFDELEEKQSQYIYKLAP